MAKGIKRAGMIIFVLAISCLLVIGCVLSINADKNNNVLDLNNNAIVDAREAQEFVPDVTLTGNNTQIANLWKQAVQSSISGNKEIKVLLDANWLAPTTEETHPFGTGNGFTDTGAICVPTGAKIKLDLNGKSINRLLTKETPIEGGNVFVVDGKLTIIDNAYSNSQIRTIYDFNKENYQAIEDNLKILSIGKITGASTLGNNMNTGSILINETGELNFYGGMITDNYARGTTDIGASGIFCNNGLFNMYDGIVFNNQSSNFRGCGITIYCGTFNMYDGFVMCNINNSTWGGGITITGKIVGEEITYGIFNMDGGIVSHNIAGHGSGITSIAYSKSNIENAEIAYNYSEANSAGMLVFQTTAEVIVKNSKFIYNYTGGVRGDFNGGVIYCQGKLDLNGVEITDNVYMTTNTSNIIRGGGVYVRANSEVSMQNVVIARNSIRAEINDGMHSFGGGFGFAPEALINFGGNVQIYDNIAHGVPSDVRLEQGQTINITENMSNNNGASHIGIKLADDYGSGTFTTGYGANNSGNNPSAYFFSNDGIKIATLKGNEVSFENTIESNVYDFVYIENGKRQNYKENNLTHAVNDYAKSREVNNGKLILGNIETNTSINTLIGNINFNRSNLKIYDNKNNVVYDKGNAIAGINASDYDNGKEFAVGTGWKIETYTDSGVIIEIIYLSVLGDINGDGRISARDVVTLREIANNKAVYENLSEESKLASMIINKGNVTTADSEIVKNVIDRLFDINIFF